jgi:hypothetical protein
LEIVVVLYVTFNEVLHTRYQPPRVLRVRRAFVNGIVALSTQIAPNLVLSVPPVVEIETGFFNTA